MLTRNRLPVLLATLCPAVIIGLALSLELAAQDFKPGADPAWISGSRSAPVTVEVFNDYQCPTCARFNVVLKKIEAEHKGDVRVIFRNFPLTRIHRNALAASEAAEAAGRQGKFIEMIDLLYEKRGQWHSSDEARQLFAAYARTLDLDVGRFVRDMKGDEVRERIRLDVERAGSLGVMGTPWVLVNGKEVEGAIPKKVRQAVAAALRRARRDR